MKKIITLFSLVLMTGFTLNLMAGNYKLDQSKMDALFAQAEQTTLNVFTEGQTAAFPGLTILEEEKDPIIALVLCSVLGTFGAHRLYLGTKTINFVLYLITGGGCGIITLVDWIQLLMVVIDDKPLSPYIDNPNFIMWKDKL